MSHPRKTPILGHTTVRISNSTPSKQGAEFSFADISNNNNVILTFRSIMDNREDINKNGDAIEEGQGTQALHQWAGTEENEMTNQLEEDHRHQARKYRRDEPGPHCKKETNALRVSSHFKSIHCSL
jgi:hypothetical protein